MAGWAEFTTARFDSVQLRGDHFALLQHPELMLTPLLGECALL
jgi:surfactin synthase thioesterase subunit